MWSVWSHSIFLVAQCSLSLTSHPAHRVSCTPLIINYSSTSVSMAIPADRQKMGSHC